MRISISDVTIQHNGSQIKVDSIAADGDESQQCIASVLSELSKLIPEETPKQESIAGRLVDVGRGKPCRILLSGPSHFLGLIDHYDSGLTLSLFKNEAITATVWQKGPPYSQDILKAVNEMTEIPIREFTTK